MGRRPLIIIKYKSVFFIAEESYRTEKGHIHIIFEEQRQEVATGESIFKNSCFP